MAAIEFVGAERIDEVDVALLRAVDDGGDVAPTLAGHEAEIERGETTGGGVQDVETVPAAFGGRTGRTNHAGVRGDLGDECLFVHGTSSAKGEVIPRKFQAAFFSLKY